jgi:hypothetical protein
MQMERLSLKIKDVHIIIKKCTTRQRLAAAGLSQSREQRLFVIQHHQ